MSKKRGRWYKPQIRNRIKKTTGKREFINVVYMEREKIDGVDHLYATCTCEKWRSSPEAKTIGAIGREAKAHVESSNGKCRLRPHDIDTQHPLEYVAEEAPE